MLQKIVGGFIVLMFAEIAMFIFIGSKIGILPTLFFIIATSFLGMFMVKKVGLHSLRKIQQEVVAGNAPAVAMIDGTLFVVGAVLLLIPGFISDILAVLLMIPITRKLMMIPIFSLLRKRLKANAIIINQRRS